MQRDRRSEAHDVSHPSSKYFETLATIELVNAQHGLHNHEKVNNWYININIASQTP